MWKGFGEFRQVWVHQKSRIKKCGQILNQLNRNPCPPKIWQRYMFADVRIWGVPGTKLGEWTLKWFNSSKLCYILWNFFPNGPIALKIGVDLVHANTMNTWKHIFMILHISRSNKLLPRRGFLCRDAQVFWCSCVRSSVSVPSRSCNQFEFKLDLIARARKNGRFQSRSKLRGFCDTFLIQSEFCCCFYEVLVETIWNDEN